ncbi:hypothetical protein [Amycolatopsis sp. WAC 04197]|uniref:hypothetical protein n=1 Tax=Amycolatopsis sp. WAC 04197 TaxID=2203199 RepID=UPI000F790C0E|nr:hypothetical protein [Amycolatopsis sp. WAC 04197]
MDLDSALADDDPLIRFQAYRERYYRLEGFAPDHVEETDRPGHERPPLLPGLLTLWQRNRDVAAFHRLAASDTRQPRPAASSPR